MRILVTGARGQLGHELLQTAPLNYELLSRDHNSLDVCDFDNVAEQLLSIRPDAIINAAAYTQVDQAEANLQQAYLVNAQAIEHLALIAKQLNIYVIHISTDFVFDGKQSYPYQPDAPTNPLNVYGLSKLQGEQYLQQILPNNSLIIRTSWVYSQFGNNFVKTILQLLSAKSYLRVVEDQIGTPTWAQSLAEIIWAILQKGKLTGTYHWSGGGVASWYDFAVAIQEEAQGFGLTQQTIPIQAIKTKEFPRPAQRPAYSVLDKTGLSEQLNMSPVHWRISLRQMLKGMRDSSSLN